MALLGTDESTDEMWNSLRGSLCAVLNKDSSNLSYEELYSYSYKMVLYKAGDQLYANIQTFLNEYFQEQILPKVLNEINKSNFLESLQKHWEYLFASPLKDEKAAIDMIRGILDYVDRIYISDKNSHLLNVFDLGLKSFRDKVINNLQVSKHLKEVILEMIAKERQNEAINLIDMKNIIKMLIALGLKNNRKYFEEKFEIPILEASQEYYQILADNLLIQCSATEYINKVDECLKGEKQRASFYLDKLTEEKILEIVKDELIAKRLINVIEMPTGLIFMLENDRIEDLKSLYNLAKLDPSCLGIDVIIQKLSAYLRQSGNKSINESNGASSIIQTLLNLKSKSDRIVEQAFGDNKDFKKSIQEDFTHIFKTEPDKCALYLASYIDEKLKKDRRNNLSDQEIEVCLDNAMILFRFLESRDAFEIYYKQCLTKRLLFERSASIDAENSMISKLKTDCGTKYSQELNQMLLDIARKEELTQGFHESAEFENCTDITTLVLTANIWPMTADHSFELPRELQFSSAKFSEYYKRVYVGRRLTYLLPNCRGEVAATCFEERYTFTATVAQISILYQFNDETVQPFAQMCDQLKMDHEFARLALKPIIGAKILTIKHGKLSDNDAIFELNFDFTFKKRKIDLTKKIAIVEPNKELEKAKKEIEDGRSFVIEAALVRIMKTRKVLRHSLLVNEVVNQLTQRFKPEGPMIKKAIESLINKGFLKRQPDAYDMIEYVA